jgi:hypothetical protein
LDYSSIHSAVEGCIGVFHVASPVPSTTVPNPEARIPNCDFSFSPYVNTFFALIGIKSIKSPSPWGQLLNDIILIEHAMQCSHSYITFLSYFHISFVKVELIEPAVKGTLNVLKASLEAKVKRVVVVSAGAAVFLNPSWPKDQVMDETSWSDKEYCRTTQVTNPNMQFCLAGSSILYTALFQYIFIDISCITIVQIF